MLAKKDNIAEQIQKLKEQEMEMFTLSSKVLLGAKDSQAEEESEHNGNIVYITFIVLFFHFNLFWF